MITSLLSLLQALLPTLRNNLISDVVLSSCVLSKIFTWHKGRYFIKCFFPCEVKLELFWFFSPFKSGLCFCIIRRAFIFLPELPTSVI